ncbi:hypothetical protein QCA50_009070 [Cerrena zonata]|uniref:Uncharacterized protein n=1 Tax=Cerrena zonata TaxID=2478898 RepID=A0AAW0G4P6_9APHY
MRFQTPLTACLFSISFVSAASLNSRQTVEVETKSLDELHQLALAEGGDLIVKAGGDERNRRDGLIKAFKDRFPGINLNLTVDLSKYHDSVIDRNLNTTGKAGADIAQLQTLHDFVRWKQEGQLLAYKPAGWEQIPDNIKDVDGAYVGTNYIAFSNIFATAKTSKEEAPTEFLDYLDPKWKGKIVSTYPNDDDAVLFQFYKIVQAHGWEAIQNFIAQDVQWVRGTATPATLIGLNNTRAVTFSASAGSWDGSTGFFKQLPKDDFSLVALWAQRTAILKTAEHPAAAKLFLNWLLSKEQQTSSGGWSVRDDVPPQAGVKPLTEFATGQMDPTAFEKFMLDRPLVERFKLQFEQLLGTAQGVSPLDDGL